MALVRWAAIFLLTLLALKILWHDMIFNVFVAEEGPGAATILSIRYLKPHSHCAGVATVHPDAGQPVYRDAPGHIS